MQMKYTKGEKVLLKYLGNKIGIIDGEPKEIKGKIFYPVSIDPSKESPYYPEESLEKYTPPKPVEELLKEKEFFNLEDFIQGLIYKKLEKPLSDNLYTFYSSRTEFQVHQFKPVLKFLNSYKQRLLLADEVGLGKTIEAGIIIREISARLGTLSRVLIVCPSMLIKKWEREMQKRFALDFNILGKNDFINFLRKYSEYGGAEKMNGIISVQTLRSNKMIEKLREISPRFDITVVDEAHCMRNPDTLSSDLGEILSELSDAMLFLSATPLQLGTPDLFNLLKLLIPEEFSDFALFHDLIETNEHINNTLHTLYDPKTAINLLKKVEETSQKERFIKNSFYHEAISLLNGKDELTRDQAIRLQKLLTELNCLSYVFTRTKKRDVAINFPIREARVIRVQFTPDEKEFYEAVTDFVAERFTARCTDSQGISFSIIMPQRQVASCIQATIESLENMLKIGTIKGPSEDDGDIIDPASDYDPAWELEDKERSYIKNLIKSAKRVGNIDTKFDKFLEALRNLEKENPKSKILVFAYFKKTLEYLRRKLETTEYCGKVELIHGDIPIKERQKIINKFRKSDEIKILLTSEVGGEGLDFEFCNVIFNYDLPWNPMRVEQRIGRLDRYGQQHEKILIYNFSMIGTIDDEILNRLYRRINIFEKYIGDLDAILGDQITILTRDMFNTKLTDEEKIQKIEKVSENIVRIEKELEEFEKECQKFIGQDEYFNQEVSRILETKRFITSDEVLFLLRSFLKKYFPKTTLLPPKSRRANVFIFKCDDDFRNFFRKYCSKNDNIDEVERKLNFDGGMQVTFNDQEACRDESLEFITIHHPIMKALKNFYEKNNQKTYPTSEFYLKGNVEFKGTYLFFIYLFEKSALKNELLLVPILVNLENKKVHIVDNLCDWFLGNIVKAVSLEDNIANYEMEDFEAMFKEAEGYLVMIREEEEQKLKKINDTLVNNQIESIKQAATIKIRKTEEIIRKLLEQGKNDEDSIVRLHKGRIRNFRISMESKIKELEEKKSISVRFSLIAGGVVKIEE